MRFSFKNIFFIFLLFNFSAFSAPINSKTKKSLEKAFNKYLKKEIARIKPFLKGDLKEINKKNLEKASKDKAFYDNLIFSIYESNRWFLLKSFGMDRDFSAIHEGCREFMYNNPEYSSKLKKSPRYKAFSYADYLTGKTFGCLYHKNSKGRMKYRRLVHQSKEVILFILRDQKILKSLKEANRSISRDISGKKTSLHLMDLFIPSAQAGIKQAFHKGICAVGIVPLWMATLPVLLTLDYSILLPFTIHNLSKGKEGLLKTGGALSGNYTLEKAYEACVEGGPK
ncbi:MAG: hypothetical protein VXY34_00605 [Bdellovibrionota bacterium]|nr:hypothetical protein [Bdellovibrionota bacterium]